MKKYLVFVEYNYTKFVFVRWEKRGLKRKAILNPPTMFYQSNRAPKEYQSLKRAESTKSMLQRMYSQSNVNVTIEEIG